MTPKFHRITIKNFRGIGLEQSVPLLDGCSLLLVGENGTGKSSVVDALDYFFTSNLERFKRQDVKTKESILFQGERDDNVANILLDWRTDGKDLSVSVDYPPKKAPVPTPPDLDSLFELAKERPFILRRESILAFITSTPATRYKKFSALIGLDELDRIEKTWRDEKNDRKKTWQTAQREKQNAGRDLLTVLPSGTKLDHVSLVAVANNWLTSLGLTTISDLKEIEVRLGELTGEDEFDKRAQQVVQLENLAQKIQTLPKAIEKLNTDYRSFYDEFTTLIRDKEILANALVDALLKEGERILEKQEDLEFCPLCQQPIVHSELLAEVKRRREELETVKAQQGKLKTDREALRSQASSLHHTVTELQKNAWVDRYQQARTLIEEIKLATGTLRNQTFSGELIRDDAFPSPKTWWAFADAGDVINALEEVVNKFWADVQALQPSNSNRQRSEYIRKLQQLFDKWTVLHKRRATTQRLESVVQQTKSIHQAFLDARQERLQSISDEITDLVNDFYTKMHPGEGHTIQIPIPSGTQVGLDSDYMGVNTHPLGLFSEGHLDTLGIAIFLAFVQKFNGDLNLLVLDDVLTTVDAAHRQLVASLLAEEFGDYQLIITTHDRLWAEQLRSTFRANNIPIIALHLNPWDERVGMNWREYKEDRWHVYREVAEKSPALGIAGAGRDLEKFLNEMRFNLELKLPARFNDQYTIGELWDPFKQWWEKKYIPKGVKKKKVDEAKGPEETSLAEHILPSSGTNPTVGELNQRLEDIDKRWRLRNWTGAHYNEWADTVTTDESIEFIKAIKAFVNMFRCPSCNAFLKYDSNTGVVSCSKKGAAHIIWLQPPRN